MAWDYLDLEIHIKKGSGRQYEVSLNTPVGGHQGVMSFPYDALALENALRGVEIAVLKSGSLNRAIVQATPETDAVSNFGKVLFDALFSNELHTALRRSQDRAREQRKGLRFRMRIDAPDLASLPWEFMYDESSRSFLTLSEGTPIVRYLDPKEADIPLTMDGPLAVLAVIASPADRATLDVEKERARLERATEEMRANGDMTIKWLENATKHELQRALRRNEFHVLHFVGHGAEGLLALVNEHGKSDLISADNLGVLLRDHHTMRLVVLNSCQGAKGSESDIFSSTASVLVHVGVPAVIAMQYEISDYAAIELATTLYEALAEGAPVDSALVSARKAVKLSGPNSVEWGTPVLYTRTMDGVIFKPGGTPRKSVRMRAPVVNVETAPTPVKPVAGAPVVSAHAAERAPAPDVPKSMMKRNVIIGAVVAALATLFIVFGSHDEARSVAPQPAGAPADTVAPSAARIDKPAATAALPAALSRWEQAYLDAGVETLPGGDIAQGLASLKDVKREMAAYVESTPAHSGRIDALMNKVDQDIKRVMTCQSSPAACVQRETP